MLILRRKKNHSQYFITNYCYSYDDFISSFWSVQFLPRIHCSMYIEYICTPTWVCVCLWLSFVFGVSLFNDILPKISKVTLTRATVKTFKVTVNEYGPWSMFFGVFILDELSENPFFQICWREYFWKSWKWIQRLQLTTLLDRNNAYRMPKRIKQFWPYLGSSCYYFEGSYFRRDFFSNFSLKKSFFAILPYMILQKQLPTAKIWTFHQVNRIVCFVLVLDPLYYYLYRRIVGYN